jgi:hypothetical protein
MVLEAFNGHTTYPWHLYDFLWATVIALCSTEMVASCHEQYHQKSKQPFIWSAKVVLSDALSSRNVIKGRANRVSRLAFAFSRSPSQRIHRRSTPCGYLPISQLTMGNGNENENARLWFRHPWRPTEGLTKVWGSIRGRGPLGLSGLLSRHWSILYFVLHLFAIY